MTTFLIVLGAMLFLVLLMSVGVLMGRKPISGSCGGMTALGMDVACDVCGGDKERCKKTLKKSTNTSADASMAKDAVDANSH